MGICVWRGRSPYSRCNARLPLCPLPEPQVFETQMTCNRHEVVACPNRAASVARATQAEEWVRFKSRGPRWRFPASSPQNYAPTVRPLPSAAAALPSPAAAQPQSTGVDVSVAAAAASPDLGMVASANLPLSPVVIAADAAASGAPSGGSPGVAALHAGDAVAAAGDVVAAAGGAVAAVGDAVAAGDLSPPPVPLTTRASARASLKRKAAEMVHGGDDGTGDLATEA